MQTKNLSPGVSLCSSLCRDCLTQRWSAKMLCILLRISARQGCSVIISIFPTCPCTVFCQGLYSNIAKKGAGKMTVTTPEALLPVTCPRQPVGMAAALLVLITRLWTFSCWHFRRCFCGLRWIKVLEIGGWSLKVMLVDQRFWAMVHFWHRKIPVIIQKRKKKSRPF